MDLDQNARAVEIVKKLRGCASRALPVQLAHLSHTVWDQNAKILFDDVLRDIFRTSCPTSLLNIVYSEKGSWSVSN